MAYAEQPRYGTAQRPQREHQRPPYIHPQQSYAAEIDYAPELSGSYVSSAPVPQQSYGAPGSNGGNASYDRNRWQDTNMKSYNSEVQYEMEERNGRGRQQPHRGPAHPHQYNDMRSGRQPMPSFGHAERDDLHKPAPHDYYQDSREPHSHQGRSQHERNFDNYPMEQGNSARYNNDPAWGPQDSWSADQTVNLPPNRQPDFPDPMNGTRQWSKGYSDRRTENAYENTYNPTSQPNVQEPPRSAHGKPPSSSSRSESSQRSKGCEYIKAQLANSNVFVADNFAIANKRIIEPRVSPDTVAWDNPFPTFPMRPKKSANQTSTMENSPRTELSRENMHEERPQTASSKSSSYTIPQHHSEAPPNISENREESYNSNTRHFQGSSHVNGNFAPERPRTSDNDRSGRRTNQLKPPELHGRHSEDNRMRPSAPIDPGIKPFYERSKTMPTSITEEPINRPRPALQTTWQEPGPVASYYGPDDRGYTPTSPQRPMNTPYFKSDQSRQKSGERRPYGHAAIPPQVTNSRQPHTPQDSLGDVFDNYYESNHHEPPPRNEPRGYQSRVEEEMPNFDGVPDSGASHQRGLTLDKHLQPNRGCPPPPMDSQDGSRNNQRSEPNVNGSVPRSRSQPNLKERRSPRAQAAAGFDFGVPGPFRPPATAPIRADYDAAEDMSTASPFSNDMPTDRGQYRGDRRNPGPRHAADYHTDLTSGPSASTFHGQGPPNGFRPPPQNGGRRGPVPMTFRDHAQPERILSPPTQNGLPRQNPQRRPGARRSSADANVGSAMTSSEYHRNGRPPPLDNGRSRDGQVSVPNGKPSSRSGTRPTSPPPKSPMNPDALPAHPAPVRAGLMESSPVNQAVKPAPVRQYHANPSPMQLSDPSQRPGSARSSESKQESMPVTHQELDRLKQATARNPSDLKTQLLLAKRLAEAASVLVDDRADQRTRNKNREKYISDAHKIVKKLSSNGFTDATFYLADCYTRGSLGLESDTREAFRLYQSAAKAGHAQAAYRVAVCCEIGQEEGGGTSRDPVKAMQWYKRAGTLGDPPAMYKMGIISLKGLLGQPKNPREAIVWLKKAAERADKENPHALHELALLHEKPSGNEGVNKDEAYSNQLFTQAANLGYKFSQYRLGSAYEYGLIGCPVDPRQSIAWYSKAAVQEEHQSELALSGWYLTGSEGVLQQSDTEAYLWARKAAQAGLAKAEYAMGYFTEVGIGAPANLEDAKRWYWRAASQNFPKARDRLEDLRKGGPTKRKERVSRSNMRKSTEGECTVM